MVETIKKKHIGCYGVVKDSNRVLLIRKSRGAYKGKLDLPGGGIEYGENALDTLRREFYEEVGIGIKSSTLKTIVTNYVIWQRDEEHLEDLQHVGIIYDVEIEKDDISNIKMDEDGNDSLGAQWYDIDSLTLDELSPLAKCVIE